jgi:hypothetical protein
MLGLCFLCNIPARADARSINQLDELWLHPDSALRSALTSKSIGTSIGVSKVNCFFFFPLFCDWVQNIIISLIKPIAMAPWLFNMSQGSVALC